MLIRKCTKTNENSKRRKIKAVTLPFFNESIKSIITYAVSLHFTQEVNEIILNTMSSIADVTGNDFMIQNKVPPHVTIGAFHGTKETEEKLIQIVEDFSIRQKSGFVRFSEIGNFNGKVLFIKPEKDSFLSAINQELHKSLMPEFEAGENGYYMPEIWFPHTTLATRLNQTQFKKAVELAGKIHLPLEAKISDIGFYQCSPFLELKRFPINYFEM